MKSVIVGIAAGLCLSLTLVRFVRDLLFQVSPVDPLTFAGVAVLVTALGVLACLVPSFRAARVDPMVALRLE
jgi:ABC-type antimicrobial peptide transport system permease subunit